MPAKSKERTSRRRQPKLQIKKGLWSREEDEKLIKFLKAYGTHCVSWSKVPHRTGLARCGKSCRLRWINYLRPDLKRGAFTATEEKIIIGLHALMGNKWSKIAKHLEGRTDNEIKNFWNSNLKKKLMKQGIDPDTHAPLPGFESQSLVPSQYGSDPKSLQRKPDASGSSASCHQNLVSGSQVLDPSPFPRFHNDTSLESWSEHSLGNYRYLLQQEELLRHVQLMQKVLNCPSQEEIYRLEGGVITSARVGRSATSHKTDLKSSQAALQLGIFSYPGGPWFDSKSRAFSASSAGQVPATISDHSSFWDNFAKSPPTGISQNSFGFDLSSTRAGDYGGLASDGYSLDWSGGVARTHSNTVGLEYLVASTGTHLTPLETGPDHLEKEVRFEDDEFFFDGSYYLCPGMAEVDNLEDAYVPPVGDEDEQNLQYSFITPSARNTGSANILPDSVADEVLTQSPRMMPEYLSNLENPQAFNSLGFDDGDGLPRELLVPETDPPAEIERTDDTIELPPPQPPATPL